ncbi:MAG: hypothetical protein Q7T48_11730 [Cellvibrio sp.]|uniref:hypothetical protein n=1 Tax=Cellvibrio sp. TaxID=1965322 RepID=UPI002727E890|nr:hypothetical protein [Cellvibrio sp.]
MNKITKITNTVFFLLILAVFIAFTVKTAPVKIIHPDALRFMAIFQQQYETVTSVSDIPSAIFHGIEKANEYDFHRGRITNYAAFGIEAMARSYLPFPFISWLTMAVLILNATLCARLVTRNLTSPLIRQQLFFLAVFVILMNPLFIASYEMQFIYSKYLCVTFMLLFMFFKRPGFKGAALLGAIFSDEIGLVFAMIAVFLIVFNQKFNAPEHKYFKTGTLLRPVAFGIAAALSVLLFYFCMLQLFFHHIAHFIQHGGFEYYVPMDVVIEKSISYLFRLARVTLGGFGIAIALLLLAFLLIKRMQLFRLPNVSQRLRIMPLQLLNRQFQKISVAMFLALFIVFKMYRGGVGIFYYGYPVFMLIMFVALTLLIKEGYLRIAIAALTILVLSLIVNLPDGYALLRNEAASVWMVDKTVSIANFNAAEAAIKEVRHKNCSSSFDAIQNSQDNNFVGTDFNYGEKYFPFLGIVKVLVWPHRVDPCAISP